MLINYIKINSKNVKKFYSESRKNLLDIFNNIKYTSFHSIPVGILQLERWLILCQNVISNLKLFKFM